MTLRAEFRDVAGHGSSRWQERLLSGVEFHPRTRRQAEGVPQRCLGLAVEFVDVPPAHSVLAYGQSPKPESPWHASQAETFAKSEMKKVGPQLPSVERPRPALRLSDFSR